MDGSPAGPFGPQLNASAGLSVRDQPAGQSVTARKDPQVVVVPSKVVQLRLRPVREQNSQLQGCGAGGSANAVRAVMERIRARPAIRTSFNNFMRPPSKVDA
jgi:hypothetical protein